MSEGKQEGEMEDERWRESEEGRDMGEGETEGGRSAEQC